LVEFVVLVELEVFELLVGLISYLTNSSIFISDLIS